MRRANGRKRFRTKFNQKKNMFEFAHNKKKNCTADILKKQDEELTSEFCSKIGVENQVLHENKKKNCTTDILPECLIQKILCFLSFKEVTKMSVLSKTWLQACSTLSTLKFTVDYPKGNTKIVDDIMERYRDGKIPIEKFDLSSSLYSHEDYPLIDKWLDIALQNGVKNLVFTTRELISYTLPIFKILAAKSLIELDLKYCDLTHASLSNGVVNCHSLRKLSLSYVTLDESMLRTLFNSCPLIDSFILEYCLRLEKIELLNLQKIKSVSIKTRNTQRLIIQAPTLAYLSYSGLSDGLDVVECQNLKSLELSDMCISDGFLQHVISRSKFLQSLILVKVSSQGLERFNIGKSKSLKLLYCDGIKEIDAPNLASIEYKGNQIPELKIARESSHLKCSKIVLHCYNNINAAWFCKLRMFLSNSSCSQVTLYVFNCSEINMKDLQLHDRVAIPQVDVLGVELHSSWESPTFVDALLWSCHPRRLNLKSTSATFTCFIDRLIYMKNLSHSPSHESEAWHSQLKEAQVYKFDKTSQSWFPVELKRGELSIRTVSEYEKYFFLLDW